MVKEEIIWKQIVVKGNETFYRCNQFGEIESHGKGKWKPLKLCMDRFGYLKACIVFNKKKHPIQAHRLIAIAFIPNPNNYPQVLHANDIKHDNRVSNMSWGTAQKNTQDAYDTGKAKGRKSGAHVMSKKVAKYFNGNLVKIYDAVNDVHRENGAQRVRICESARTGKPYQGFNWKYI